MKYLFLILGLFCQVSVFAQVDTTIYNSSDIEIKPETPLSSEKEWLNSLAAVVKYPEIARKYKIQGRVTMQFVVEKDGKPNHIRILGFRSNRAEISEVLNKKNSTAKVPIDVKAELDKCEDALKSAAIEMMKTSAPFIPGKNKGQYVRTKFYMPLTFNLQ